MFSLSRHTSKLNNLNIRDEKHGDEHKVAVDLSITIEVPSSDLADFDPQLRYALYKKDDTAQGQLENVEQELTKLKFPWMSPFSGNFEYAGHEAIIYWGTTGHGDISLDGVQINKFKFEPKEGGTVEIKFRIQAYPNEKQIGQMSTMVGQSVVLSLIEPKQE